MTIEAVPGATALAPTLPGLPLMKTKGLTPMATTVSTRPLAVTFRVVFTKGLVGEGVGVAVGFRIGVGVGFRVGVGRGVTVAVGVALGFGVGEGLAVGSGPWSISFIETIAAP